MSINDDIKAIIKNLIKSRRFKNQKEIALYLGYNNSYFSRTLNSKEIPIDFENLFFKNFPKKDYLDTGPQHKPEGRQVNLEDLHPNLKKLSQKEAMTKDWYVGCKFYDPEHKDKYPKGFFWRKKGLAEYKTFQERKKAALILKDEMQLALDNLYNPIISKFQNIFIGDFSPDNYLMESLETALEDHKPNITHGYYKSILSNLNTIKPVILRLKIDKIPIKDIQLKHIKSILDNSELSNNSYNKFRKHLSVLFKILCANSCMVHNPCENIPTKNHIKKEHQILTQKQFDEIYNHLLKEHPYFANYMQIFHMSGCRSTELLNVRKEDVKIENQEFTITVKKRKKAVRETRIIIPEALPFWEKQLEKCKSDNDFLFGENFAPENREKPRCSDSPGKYWAKFVNKIFKTNTTFYPLKHFFLDKVEKNYGINAAQKMAGHLNGKTTEIYTVFKRRRELEELKNLKFKENTEMVSASDFLKFTPEQLN